MINRLFGFIRALRHEPVDRVPLLYRAKHEAKAKLARIYGIEDASTGRKHNPELELRLGNDAIIYQIGINADFSHRPIEIGETLKVKLPRSWHYATTVAWVGKPRSQLFCNKRCKKAHDSAVARRINYRAITKLGETFAEQVKGKKVESIEGSVGNFTTRVASNGDATELTHGVVVVATGAREYEPKEYLYGQDQRVITQLELEGELGVMEEV